MRIVGACLCLIQHGNSPQNEKSALDNGVGQRRIRHEPDVHDQDERKIIPRKIDMNYMNNPSIVGNRALTLALYTTKKR